MTQYKVPPKDLRRIATVSFVGASIESYDFFIYGTAAALVFPKLFFPNQSPLIGILLSFATFGVGFVARPIGGVIFGHIGDVYGRKKAVVLALVGMGVGTTIIGLLPTQATIGIAAPILLVLVRLLQGVVFGGEAGGVLLLVTEAAPDNRRGFYGALALAGAPGGVIIGNVIFFAMVNFTTDGQFESWGWRVPFLLSVVLVGLSLYTQLRIEETPAFKQMQEARTALLEEEPAELVPTDLSAKDATTGGEATGSLAVVESTRSPIIEALRTYPKQIALSAGAYAAINMTFYIFVAFVVSYASNPDILGMKKNVVLGAVLIGSFFMLVAGIGFGALSDRFGRHKIAMWGAGLLGVWSFAFWPLVNTKSFLALTVALVVGLGIFMGMMSGPIGAIFVETFPTNVRFSGISLGIQIASVLAGAFAPLLATALLARFDSTVPISIYMAVVCLITVVSLWLLDNKYPKVDVSATGFQRRRDNKVAEHA